MSEKKKFVSLPIEGMTCASCVLRIEKTLQKLNGVENISVNLASEKVSFNFDEGKIQLDDIAKLVEKIGYKIKFQKINFYENYLQIRKEFLLSLFLSIPIVFGNMFSMSSWFHFSAMGNLFFIIFILTSFVIFFSGKRFFLTSFKLIKTFSFDMNSLVAVGSGIAYLYSSYALFFPSALQVKNIHEHIYFDTSASIITLILFGKFLETKSKTKTNNAIQKLLELQPNTATILKDEKEIQIEISQLKIGDIVVIKQGEKISADGKVVKGNAEIDESMLTGESIFVEKKIADKVFCGTINMNGIIYFQVEAIKENTVLSQIVKLVEVAQSSKIPIQSFVDKVSSIFVPIVFLVSIATFLTMIFLNFSISNSMMSAISVLIIACPCALGLATPMAIIVGIGLSAKNGILIKNAESIENIGSIDTIVFDKTGTITEGKLKVCNFISTQNYEKKNLFKIISSIEKKSNHPIAKVVFEFTKNNSNDFFEVNEFENLTGFGVKGKIENKEILIGNFNLMQTNKIDILKINSEENNTIIFVAIDKTYVATFFLSDIINMSAKNIIQKLKQKKIGIFLLTGDNLNVAKKIANEVEIENIFADVLPNEKANKIKELQSQKKIIAMVGDGINDSIALAQANVGIALGTGTDIAIESADVTILKNDLNKILKAIDISKLTIRTIRQNLFWAFIYNIVGIPIAAFGFLNPIFAALFMTLSSVSVIANSLRIKLEK